MNGIHFRGEKYLKAFFRQPQAKIDVSEFSPETLVKTPDTREDLARDHHASRGDGGDVSLGIRKAE